MMIQVATDSLAAIRLVQSGDFPPGSSLQTIPLSIGLGNYAHSGALSFYLGIIVPLFGN
jgi:hypothetical protein